MVIKFFFFSVREETNNVKLLYIVTDGALDPLSAKNFFELNKDMQYEKVIFHAFNEDVEKINLSVAASFFKGHCMVHRNNELIDDIDISQEFDYERITVGNFVTEIKSLKSYIKLKFIRTFKQDVLALEEIEKLQQLRERLFDDVSLKSEINKVNLETKDKNMFLQEFISSNWYRGLTCRDQNAKDNIENSISALIDYIMSDNKSYSFDALKIDTKFVNPVEKEPIVDVDFQIEQEIEFPDIILEDDQEIIVIVLTEFNLLNQRAKKWTLTSDFESAIECPLFLMNDPDISKSICFHCSLNGYKQLLEMSKAEPNTEPKEWKQFHGKLVITNTDLFDKYNDYVLLATYFGSKKVNFNIGLFYFMLWKNCQSREKMTDNVKEQFKKYVMRRISTTVCKIGLSSSPQNSQENVTLPIALWYCIELSSCIFKDDPQNFMHERLRIFYAVAHWMIEILQYLNYDLDVESIEKRRELIGYVMTLKDIPTRREKAYYLLEEIFKKVGGFLVSEIENPFNLKKLNYLKFNHRHILCDDVMKEKVNMNDYVYLANYVGDLSESETGKCMFKICRPVMGSFLIVEEDKSFSTELVKATRKIVINDADDEDKINITYEAIDLLDFDNILCRYNLFIDCVRYLMNYPTLPEYIEYMSKTRRFSCEMVNIFPPNIVREAKHTYFRYQKMVRILSVDKFIKDCSDCIYRSTFIKHEKLLKGMKRFMRK